MRSINIITPGDRPVRTQITLTKKLKASIEARALSCGISMSEYLRRAALRSLKEEEKEKEHLNRLIHAFIGSISFKNHPTWKSPQQVRRWVRELRAEK